MNQKKVISIQLDEEFPTFYILRHLWIILPLPDPKERALDVIDVVTKTEIIEQLEKPNVFDKANGNAFTREKDSACLLGLRVKAYAFQPIADLKSEANFKERRWNNIWWHKCRSINAILSQHNASYSPDCVITSLDSTNVTN